MCAKETRRIPIEQRGVQNIAIENDLAIKRIYQSEPIDLSCWAYMRALRQVGSTKKVYPVNPYVEVYRFQENLYGLLTESSDGMGDPWMYLIIGPEKAMLIDTGFGVGDLKGLCREICGDKELIVANTHGHYDHAYGNAQFDKVYCHEYEVPSLAQQNEHTWDYLFEDGDRSGQPIWAEFNEQDIIPFKPYEIVGCPDGYTFDLGDGHEVELVHLGGHSCGSCGFLDKGTRSFFAGDDIINMRVGISGRAIDLALARYSTVSTLRDALARVADRLDEFDHVYPGHFVTALENSAVTATLEACNAICQDPVGNSTYYKDTEQGRQYFRYVKELGVIAYWEHSV